MIKVPNLLISQRSPHPKLPAGCSGLRKVSWDGQVSSWRFESGGEWQSGRRVGFCFFFFFNLCRIPAEASVRSWGTPEVSQLPHITASFLQFTSSNLTQSFTGACLSALAFGFQLPWCPFASEKKKSEECLPLTLSNYLDLLITTKSTLVSW